MLAVSSHLKCALCGISTSSVQMISFSFRAFNLLYRCGKVSENFFSKDNEKSDEAPRENIPKHAKEPSSVRRARGLAATLVCLCVEVGRDAAPQAVQRAVSVLARENGAQAALERESTYC